MRPAGYIFMCSDETQAACLDNLIFATTSKSSEEYKYVDFGKVCFLWNVNSRKLFGAWTAMGQMSQKPIKRHVFDDKKFPVQVSVQSLFPDGAAPYVLIEEAKELLRMPHKLSLRLDEVQVQMLLDLVRNQFYADYRQSRNLDGHRQLGYQYTDIIQSRQSDRAITNYNGFQEPGGGGGHHRSSSSYMEGDSLEERRLHNNDHSQQRYQNQRQSGGGIITPPPEQQRPKHYLSSQVVVKGGRPPPAPPQNKGGSVDSYDRRHSRNLSENDSQSPLQALNQGVVQTPPPPPPKKDVQQPHNQKSSRKLSEIQAQEENSCKRQKQELGLQLSQEFGSQKCSEKNRKWPRESDDVSSNYQQKNQLQQSDQIYQQKNQIQQSHQIITQSLKNSQDIIMEKMTPVSQEINSDEIDYQEIAEVDVKKLDLKQISNKKIPGEVFSSEIVLDENIEKNQEKFSNGQNAEEIIQSPNSSIIKKKQQQQQSEDLLNSDQKEQQVNKNQQNQNLNDQVEKISQKDDFLLLIKEQSSEINQNEQNFAEIQQIQKNNQQNNNNDAAQLVTEKMEQCENLISVQNGEQKNSFGEKNQQINKERAENDEKNEKLEINSLDKQNDEKCTDIEEKYKNLEKNGFGEYCNQISEKCTENEEQNEDSEANSFGEHSKQIGEKNTVNEEKATNLKQPTDYQKDTKKGKIKIILKQPQK